MEVAFRHGAFTEEACCDGAVAPGGSALEGVHYSGSCDICVASGDEIVWKWWAGELKCCSGDDEHIPKENTKT
jgi:hypothetical protein